MGETEKLTQLGEVGELRGLVELRGQQVLLLMDIVVCLRNRLVELGGEVKEYKRVNERLADAIDSYRGQEEKSN